MPTTAAFVRIVSGGFDDFAPDILNLQFEYTFNGPTGGGVGGAVYPRNTTNMGVKQAAIRDSINSLLGTSEPGVTLTNANIQISGMPI